MSQSHKYEGLATEPEESLHLNPTGYEEDGSPKKMGIRRYSCQFRFMLPLLWVLGCLLFLIGAMVHTRVVPSLPDLQLVYSPAQEALAYQREIYPDAFSELTHFMGEPSPQLDAYWEETYDLPTRIPKWQAEKLERPTIELPDDPGYYVVLLDIFHSLHCLNELRKSLHPEYYAPYHLRMNTTEAIAQKHLDHCVEHVRLALWCGADISPISFRWKADNTTSGMSGYPHTCRDPRAIIKWGRENKVKKPLP